MEKVKVSIFCLTYNHAPYIKEALDGFLMQKTNFNFNILIFDDASTDGTSDIIREYQKKHPDLIHAYISPVNTLGKFERIQILNDLYDKYLTGEYVAWCEGDDAWTRGDKLQMQVDFMEHNANCVMTVHAAKWINYAENTVTSKRLCAENRYMLPEEVILRISWSIPMASVVMKKNVFLMRDGFPPCDVGDFPMQLYALHLGDIYYFNEEMSIYRYMQAGSWSREHEDNHEKYVYHGLNFIDFLIKYNTYTNKRFEKLVRTEIAFYLSVIAEKLCKVGDARSLIENIHKINYHLYDSLIKEIIPVYDRMSGNYQMDAQTREMLTKYEHICIMGKGNYSKFIVSGLNKNGIRYDGHLLSKKDVSCDDSNVWDVLDFPYNKETTLVIVGINQVQEAAITETLTKHGFKHVWCPLWFNKENILR